MSLQIPLSLVASVLLADGWHDVEVGSFDVDAYEFCEDFNSESVVFRGGQDKLIPAAGFIFHQQETRYVGPLSSILAIKLRTPGPAKRLHSK